MTGFGLGGGHGKGHGKKGAVTQYPASPVVTRVDITSASPPNFAPSSTYQLAVEVYSGDVPDTDGGLTPILITGRTVTYETSNSGVATVNGSGLVTAVAAGSCTIRAVCEGARSGTNNPITVVVTSPQNAVSSVTLTPSSPLTLAVSATTTVSATVKDASNNVLTGKTVTWSSTDTNKVTVSADSGTEAHQTTVTGVATGGAPTIKATCEAVDSSSLAVTVSSSSDLVYFADKFGSGSRKASTGGYGWTSADSTVTISNLNPYSGDSYSMHFAMGTAGGKAEQRFQLGANLTEVYLGWYHYIPNGAEGTGSADYYHRNGPSSDNNKWLRLWDSYAGSADAAYSASRVKCGASTRPQPSTGGESNLDMGDQIIWKNASGVSVYYGDAGQGAQGPPPWGYTNWIVAGDHGTWIKIQFRAKLATSTTANDGILQWWKNGTQVFSHTALDFIDHQNLGNWFKYGYLLGADNSGWNATTVQQIARFRIGSSLTAVDPASASDW